jgi:hypothetical protein
VFFHVDVHVDVDVQHVVHRWEFGTTDMVVRNQFDVIEKRNSSPEISSRILD